MAFDLKVCLVTDGGELVNGEADIYVYHAVTLCAGQVMVMVVATDTVVMCTIGKLDAIQQAHADELFHRTENCCPAQARLYLPQFMPEIIGRKIGTTGGKLYQSLGDEPPRARAALAYFVECCTNSIRYHLEYSLSERYLALSRREEAVPSIILSLPRSVLHDKLSADPASVCHVNGPEAKGNQPYRDIAQERKAEEHLQGP